MLEPEIDEPDYEYPDLDDQFLDLFRRFSPYSRFRTITPSVTEQAGGVVQYEKRSSPLNSYLRELMSSQDYEYLE